MKTKLYLLVLVIVLASLGLAACGGGSSSDAAFPTGTFVDSQDSNRGYIFNADNTWSYFSLGTGTISATGTYSVDGNRWTEAGGQDNCQPATYVWTFDGSNLTFKLQGKDECAARSASLDGHTFILKK